jgi:hypothetical protein
MSRVTVGRTRAGAIVLFDACGVRVELSVADARWVRDELTRAILADADDKARALSVADFKAE